MAKEINLTWGELKKFVNELPEEQLSKKIIWWGDERGGVINAADTLEEDYVNMDYGYEPESVYLDDEEYKEDLETAERLEKGTPVLLTE